MLYNIININTIPETIFAHVYSCPNYQVNFREMLPNIEIAYVETGAVSLEIMGEKIFAEEKSFLVLPHKYKFKLTSLENQAHIHYTVSAMIDADSYVTIDIPEKLAPESMCVPIHLPNCHQTKFLLSTLNNIIRENQKSDSISRYKCASLVMQLLCDIARASEEGIGAKSSASADILDSRVKKYIENHIGQKICLADISECIGKNANYLNQVFKRKNNMSIISYVNLIKMKKVASLIIDNAMTLKEAGEMVGIGDESYLSRLFKSTMGMTISEYKENSADYLSALIDFKKVY